LTIERSGVGLKQFDITREAVTPPAMNASTYRTNTGTVYGYIRIFDFTPDLPSELQNVLGQFAQRNVTGWVLDLRDSPGGTVDSFIGVGSEFIGTGPLAILQARNGSTQTVNTTGGATSSQHHMVVIVNDGTASAAEMLAAALQESNQTAVVGSQTAGCVAVGKVTNLSDGSALEYAVDRVYTPVQHHLLNGVGVTPNVVVPMTLDDLAAGKDPQLSAAAQVLLQGQVTPASPSSQG
jgi:carboxyl-terminal processing protease